MVKIADEWMETSCKQICTRLDWNNFKLHVEKLKLQVESRH